MHPVCTQTETFALPVDVCHLTLMRLPTSTCCRPHLSNERFQDCLTCGLQAANVLRKSHGIKVTGGKAPPLLASFAELEGLYGCSKCLLAKLEEHGWQEPTAIQRQAIPTLLKGRELFAVAPTGMAPCRL